MTEKMIMAMTSKDGENIAFIKRMRGPRRPYYEVSMHTKDGLMPDDSMRLQTTSFKSAVHEARAWTGRGTLEQTHERVMRKDDYGLSL